MKPIPRLTRWYMWRAGNDVDFRDWLDFALVVVFIVGMAWVVGLVTP